LYRCDSSSTGKYRHIATVQHTNTSTISYYDTVYTNRTCYYKLAVFDKNDRGSRLSRYESGYFKTFSGLYSVTASNGTFDAYILIDWSLVSLAVEYNIYRATTSSGPYSLIDSSTKTTYYDSSIVDTSTTNQHYYYKVTAVRQDGRESAFSSYDYGYLRPFSYPAIVNASRYMYGSHIAVSWSRVAKGTGYNVYRSTSTSSSTFAKIAAVTDTFYCDSAVKSDSTYYYKLSALKESTESSLSSYESGNRRPPSFPSNIFVGSEQYMTHIPISWTASSGADWYCIYRHTPSTGTFTRLASTTAVSYNDSTPLPNIVYYYKIAAYSIVGEGTPSSPKSGKLLWAFPSPPDTVGATKGTKVDTITITWSSCLNTTYYAVFRDTETVFTNPELRCTTTVTTFHDTVHSDTSYVYRIKSINQVGESVLSTAYDIGYRKPSAAPLAPEDLVADSLPTHIPYPSVLVTTLIRLSGTRLYYLPR